MKRLLQERLVFFFFLLQVLGPFRLGGGVKNTPKIGQKSEKSEKFRKIGQNRRFSVIFTLKPKNLRGQGKEIFAKQLLHILVIHELLLFRASRNSSYFPDSGQFKISKASFSLSQGSFAKNINNNFCFARNLVIINPEFLSFQFSLRVLKRLLSLLLNASSYLFLYFLLFLNRV